MGVVTRYADALWQLARPDPVAAWGVGAFLLGGAAGWFHTGGDLFWLDGLYALIAVVLIQAFGSHGLNDVYDWLTGTDKESIGKGTGGTRVIPQGKLSILETALVAVIALGAAAGIGLYFIDKYGTVMIAITVLAIAAPVVYSMPPFKLAYRPFPELIIITPTLIAVTVTAELVLSGQITLLSIGLGLVHAMYNIGWYMVSRLPDYEPDRAVGKTTTVVYLGRDNAPLMSSVYLGIGLAAVPVLAAAYTPVIMLSGLFYLWMVVGLFDLDPYDPHQASATRRWQIRKATVHAVVMAALIVMAAGV